MAFEHFELRWPVNDISTIMREMFIKFMIGKREETFSFSLKAGDYFDFF